jgi:hypothetical protein
MTQHIEELEGRLAKNALVNNVYKDRSASGSLESYRFDQLR